LSLKDNVSAIKEELSTEEQFLESVIKAEGFWKKYKKILITLATLLLVGVLAKALMGYLHDKDIQSSNEAYALLLKNPKDTTALATLKSSNPKLYELFLFQSTASDTDVASLSKSIATIKDPVLHDLMQHQLSSLQSKPQSAKTTIMKELALLEEGYLLLESNKIKEAKAKLAQIDKMSPLFRIASQLTHYMGE
jgi:hypothetical protein